MRRLCNRAGVRLAAGLLLAVSLLAGLAPARSLPAAVEMFFSGEPEREMKMDFSGEPEEEKEKETGKGKDAETITAARPKQANAPDASQAPGQEAGQTAGQDSEQTPSQSNGQASQQARQVLLSMGETPGTMYISWTGTRRGPQYLRYADDKYRLPAAAARKAQSTRLLKGESYRYKAKLTGLEPGQLYYYEIGDGAAFDSPGYFRAPSETGETVFAYLGDPQTGSSLREYESWQKLVREMYKTNPDIDFAITGGDMVNIPTRQSQWNAFLDSCSLFRTIPLMTIPGNHEGVTANTTYKKIFHNIQNGPEGEAFYFFDCGHCRFIMLDSSFLTKVRQKAMGQALWTAREQELESWLRRTLSESPKPWNIIVTHHPVYGLHDIATVSTEIRRRWLPILEEGGADLVLCGHQHTYMRSKELDGITHIMGNSGGKRSKYYRGFNRPEHAQTVYAAGPNYQIIRAKKRKLELISYDSSNTVIDSIQLEKNPWSDLFR